MGMVRVLLALSVVFAHSSDFPLTGNRLVGGLVAVQCFYIISGFYMALVLSNGYHNIKDFYFNRFLRLYPTYWLILFGLTLMKLGTGQDTFVQAIMDSSVLQLDGKLLMLFSNVFIFGSEAILFMFTDTNGLHFTANIHAHEPVLYTTYHAIPQAWTLPIEMLFYAIAPFIVKSRLRLIALAVASICLRYLVYRHVAADDPWTYRFFPLELAFFCAGSLAFHAYSSINSRGDARHFGLILLVLLVVYICNFDRVPVILPNSFVFSGNLIQFYLFILFSLPFIFHATRSNQLDQWLGELSYPIYICHLAIIAVLPNSQRVYYILAYVIFLSMAINIFLQAPIERRFKRASTGTPGAEGAFAGRRHLWWTPMREFVRKAAIPNVLTRSVATARKPARALE